MVINARRFAPRTRRFRSSKPPHLLVPLSDVFSPLAALEALNGRHDPQLAIENFALNVGQLEDLPELDLLL